MKFSNFVSTLAVVYLAFNADAISLEEVRHLKPEHTNVVADPDWFWDNARSIIKKETKYISQVP